MSFDFSTATFVVGLGGLIAAIVTIWADELRDRRSRRAKSPRWFRWRPDQALLVASRSNPAVSQNDHTIIGLPTVTRIAFWNAGFVTINRGDVSPTEPFRVAGKDDMAILEVREIRNNSRGSGLRVVPCDDGEWIFDFDYLRPEAGGLYAVTHSGIDESTIEVVGEVIEGNTLRNAPYPAVSWSEVMPKLIRDRIGDRWSHRLVVLWYIPMAGILIYGIYAERGVPTTGHEFFVFTVTVIGGVIATWISVKFMKGWRIDVPDSLRPFDPSDN